MWWGRESRCKLELGRLRETVGPRHRQGTRREMVDTAQITKSLYYRIVFRPQYNGQQPRAGSS